jgi:hypothetical protein
MPPRVDVEREVEVFLKQTIQATDAVFSRDETGQLAQGEC